MALQHQTSLAKIKEGSTVYKTISDSLLKYIPMDFAPLSTVESVWFKEYTKNLNPRYDLPTRKKIDKSIISRLLQKSKG